MAAIDVDHNAVYLAGYRRGFLGLPSDASILSWLHDNGFDAVRVYGRLGAGDDPNSAKIGIKGPDGATVATNLPFAIPFPAGKDPGDWDTLVQARRAGPTGPVELPLGASQNDLEWLVEIPPQGNASNLPPLGPPAAIVPAQPGAVVPAAAQYSLGAKLYAAAGVAAFGACIYHGYKRNDSLAWALVWGLAGGFFPVVAVPIAVAQGFGERRQ